MRRWKVPALLSLLSATAIAGEAVQVQDHGDGRYTLSTVVHGTMDPGEGLVAITPEALTTCGARFPHFGKYRFEAWSQLGASDTPGPESLRYSHDITCHDAPQETIETASMPVPPAPDSPPTEDDAAIINALTLAYFTAKENADADAAYQLLSPEMASYATPEEWAATRSAFNAKVGPGAETRLVRTTWYDNPANAPSLGRYVAVDYGVTYPSQGFTCGYVMWLRQADGGYLIVREEKAQVTPDNVAGLSPEQVASMRAQLMCRD
ncbi:DUF4019 domain-containing protein [Luteimonas sp. A534]